jgi:hypothetical protein
MKKIYILFLISSNYLSMNVEENNYENIEEHRVCRIKTCISHYCRLEPHRYICLFFISVFLLITLIIKGCNMYPHINICNTDFFPSVI